jgi:hypothetical protein
MWDVPGYRVRAYVQATRKAREEAKERRRPRLHFQRTVGELRLAPDWPGGSEELLPARVVLNDLYPRGVFVFTPSALMPGRECAITIPEPRRFYIRGVVTSCKEIATGGRVLPSDAAFKYRVAIEFDFGSVYEEESVREYCTELAADFLYRAP